MNFTINPAEREDLLQNKDLISANSHQYNSVEQYALYNLYNRIYGTHKAPNGCSSCLRSTLQGLKKALQIVEKL
jgi:hypothetical protein